MVSIVAKFGDPAFFESLSVYCFFTYQHVSLGVSTRFTGNTSVALVVDTGVKLYLIPHFVTTANVTRQINAQPTIHLFVFWAFRTKLL